MSRTVSATVKIHVFPPDTPSATTFLAGKINPLHNFIQFPSRCLFPRATARRSHLTTSLSPHHRRRLRQRLIPSALSSPSSSGTREEFPLLPFPMEQVLVPTESKTLHLFEARYLALLDESLSGKKKHFVHFVLDPIGISDSAEASFAARYGCLVLIEKVEQLDIGALVSIRGIGRAAIFEFVQADPYLRGTVTPEQDVASDSISKASSLVMELKEALSVLNSLEIKLKAPKEALLQTNIANSVSWAENECSLDYYGAFLPSLTERLSFAAFQPLSGSSQSELQKLQKEKLRAMGAKSTMERLKQSLEFVRSNISMVAAKLAIQSLDSK